MVCACEEKISSKPLARGYAIHNHQSATDVRRCWGKQMLTSFVALLVFALNGAAMQSAASDDAYAPGRKIVSDIDRIVTPKGVQETFEVVLGGARQIVNVRGSDRANPILLFVHGGPGAVEMPVAWAFQRPWEDFFTVVQWDQRGAGRSFPLNNPKTLAPTLTPERYRDDAIELIQLLCHKYNKRKVLLLGHIASLRRTNKNDRRDAERLARYGRIDPALLAPIAHRSEELQLDLAVIKVPRRRLAICRWTLSHTAGARREATTF